MNLELTAPISRWDEAIPLGNGLLGGLLWGEGNLLRISLDRGDLWDERPAPGDPLGHFTYFRMAELVAHKDNAAVSEILDKQAYDQLHPTKIPAGRLELELSPSEKVMAFSLDFPTATARATLANGGKAEMFFSAVKPYAVLRVSGTTIQAMRLVPAATARKLHFPEAEHGAEGLAQWFVQATAEGHKFCVYAQTRQMADATFLATAVAFSPADGVHVLAVARARVESALKLGYIAAHKPHAEWWRDFWAKSLVKIPDAQVQGHYEFGQYLYGSASRGGAPPMPQQGVWTADSGELPPWKGDYHFNGHAQLAYIGYLTSGRFEEGRTFLDFMMARLPVFREFARRFYETPGAAVPGSMSLAGRPLGGWAQSALSPTSGAWISQLFYLHWRYTRDEKFLREVALPWCREIGECLAAMMGPDSRGVLVLPLSSSPEVWNNDQRAWLAPNSTHDISCLRMLFTALQEMSEAAGADDETPRWRQIAGALGPMPISVHGLIQLAANEDLKFSHRHFSTLLALYPFNLLSIEGTDKEQALIRRNLAEIQRLGVREWHGWSYTWMAAMRARVGDAESALWHLKAYLHAFVSRNGFHLHGDQTQSGFSAVQGRPFTVTGNLLACAAVHEMLLQSWDPHPGAGGWGALRIFPAMPWSWHDAEFADLMAEGGFKVSARRKNNATVWFRITAAREGEMRIRDNFGGRVPTWIRPGVRKVGHDYLFTVRAGGVVEATLPQPEFIGPAPADAIRDEVPKPPAELGTPMYS